MDVTSQTHRAIYGAPIEWTYHDKKDFHHTIPFVDDRMEFPEGWHQIYNVHPRLLLERGFDKVIVLRRNKEEWIRVTLLYFLKTAKYRLKQGKKTQLGWLKDVKRAAVERDLSSQWDTIYGEIPNDEKCYLVDLENLNNHSVDTFSELFDFLEFRRFYKPIFGRPIMLVIKPPHRNWEKYSGDYPRYQEYADSLDAIGALYDRALDKILNEQLEEWD